LTGYPRTRAQIYGLLLGIRSADRNPRARAVAVKPGSALVVEGGQRRAERQLGGPRQLWVQVSRHRPMEARAPSLVL
jgi:hypothetical protein